jgi:hypothetical protein
MRTFEDSQKLREWFEASRKMTWSLIDTACRIAIGVSIRMASAKKSSIEISGQCYRHSWFRSLSWVFMWTLVFSPFSPFWLIASHGAFCGLEPRMRKLGMENYNEFLFYSGYILAMAGLPLGLLASEIVSRRGRGRLLVGLSGIAVFFLSLLAGISL